MQGMYADEDDIVVLVNQLDSFLYLAVYFGVFKEPERLAGNVQKQRLKNPNESG